MKDFNQISSFVTVVKAGSFSKAARELGVPKSTLSHRVSELESRLGVTLMLRTTRQLKLTPAGDNYFRKSVLLLQELDQLEEETMSEQAEPQGILKFTAPIEAGNEILPGPLDAFARAYPKIQLHLDLTDRKVDLVREGFDVALRAGKLEDSSLLSKNVGQGEVNLYAAPSYLKKAPPLKTPDDLNAHVCIVFAPDNRDIVWTYQKGAQKKEFRPKGHIRTNHFTMTLKFVCLGRGVSWMPRFLAAEAVAKGLIVPVLADWNWGRSPMSLLYPPQPFRSKKLEVFLDFMVPRLRQTQW